MVELRGGPLHGCMVEKSGHTPYRVDVWEPKAESPFVVLYADTELRDPVSGLEIFASPDWLAHAGGA